MTPDDRLYRAIDGQVPDRVPVTVHQWQKYHLDKYLGGISALEAFRRFGMDATISVFAYDFAESAQWRRKTRTGTDVDGNVVTYTEVITPGGKLFSAEW